MAMGGPEGPQNAGGSWGIGSLASALTSTVYGLFGGKTAEATDGEIFLASVGAKHHKPIETRSVSEVVSKSYERLKQDLIKAIEAGREDESGGTDNLDVVRRGALETCLSCLKKDNMNELLRNHRNYPELFPSFPLDSLLDKWKTEQGINPELPDTEVFPERYENWQEFECDTPIKNLTEMKDQFRFLYRDFMNDTQEFALESGGQRSANNPNTRVLTTRRALEYLNQGDVKGFIDIYQTSHWLNTTLPVSFLPCLSEISANDLHLDQAIKVACKPMRHSSIYEHKGMPLNSAAMMKKNYKAMTELSKAIKTEICTAREVDSPSRLRTANGSLDALKSGDWQALIAHMKENPVLKKAPLEEAVRLKEKESHLGYVAHIALARILTTYKRCLAEGTAAHFLYKCCPIQIDIKDHQDHWTSKLKNKEYDFLMELSVALADKQQKAAIESALDEFMPELVSGNLLA